MIDMVNHPAHYKSADGSEVIDIIVRATEDLRGIEAYDAGNMIKYICRWKWKNGIQDVEKCRWYARHLMNQQKINRLIHRKRNVKPEYSEFAAAATVSFTAQLSGDEYMYTSDILFNALMWWYEPDRHLGNIIRTCDMLIEHLRKNETNR